MAATAAIRLAVRNYLRDQLDVRELLARDSFGCEVTDNGRPVTPYAGLLFIGIHGSRQTGIRIEGGTGERHGIDITVSMKTARVPRWQIGNVILDNLTDGLDYVCDKVKVLVQTFEILPLANQLLLSAGMPVECQGMFRLTQSPDPEPKMAEWWGSVTAAHLPQAQKGQVQLPPAPVGFAKKMSFEGIETYRPLGET